MVETGPFLLKGVGGNLFKAKDHTPFYFYFGLSVIHLLCHWEL